MLRPFLAMSRFQLLSRVTCVSILLFLSGINTSAQIEHISVDDQRLRRNPPVIATRHGHSVSRDRRKPEADLHTRSDEILGVLQGSAFSMITSSPIILSSFRQMDTGSLV